MKSTIKNLSVKKIFAVGILLCVCAVCLLFVGWQISFANGTTADDNVEFNELKYTEDNNAENQNE